MRITAMTLIVLSLGTGGAMASQVATVTQDQGSVLVDSGKGFAKIGASAVVPDGSRVLVAPKSHGTIAYADGCKLPLSASSITTVSSKVGCNPASQVAGADLTPDQIVQPAPVYHDGRLAWGLVAGGAAAAGGLIGYLLANPNDNTVYVYVPVSK